jgi:hypothetical protein
MKKLLLASTLLLAGTFPALADNFTLSDFNGTGQYGTFTATALTGGVEQVVINMDPNVLIQNGDHFLLTLSLLGTGRIDGSSVMFGSDPPTSYTVLDHGGDYDNGPFKNFTDGLNAVGCDPAHNIGCGMTLTFNVTGFQGFGFGLNTIDGANTPVLAAVDVLLLSGCTGETCTGPVGVSSVPGPVVGAGLPGLVSACFGLFGLNRWRRRRQAA